MKPMTVGEIAEGLGGILRGRGETVISAVSTDSRTISTGALFIPLVGEIFDGHAFLKTAYEKGAACALSSQEFPIREGQNLILVEDTSEALLQLAEIYRRQFSLPVIAITGSVGKTSVKDMMAAVLRQKYHVLKTQGNFNNTIGVPLTLFQLEDSYDAAIIEIGMNHFGEIHRLAKAARPDIAVITNIGVAHIENLGDRDGILKAKSEIFDFLSEDGLAILNFEDDKLIQLKETLPKSIWYGKGSGLYADEMTIDESFATRCRIHTAQGSFSVTIPVPGAHMVSNALAATAVGLALGVTLSEIQKGLSTFAPTKMRMSVSKMSDGITWINDAYNANPVSMRAAIDVLAEATGRRICILGDMAELGEHAEKMHYEVGEYAAKKGIDQLIFIGPLSIDMERGAKDAGHTNAQHYGTQEAFWDTGCNTFLSGDTILIKASRSMALEKTVEKLQGVN